MAQQLIQRLEPQQGMHQAAVTHIDLRRLDQPLAVIGMKRRQPPHQQQIDHQIQIARHRLAINAQRPGQLRRIEKPPLAVRQHHPEPAQRFGGDACGGQEGQIALKIRGDEIFPPECALGVISGQKAARKAAPAPQGVGFCGCDLQPVQRRQFQIGNPPGERFARLPQQIHRRRSQQQEMPCRITRQHPRINQAAQHLKQLRRALHLIKDNQAILPRPQKRLGIRQFGAVCRTFKIKIQAGFAGDEGAGQSGLAHLARPQQGDSGKLAQTLQQYGGEATGNHDGCNSGILFLNCKVFAEASR